MSEKDIKKPLLAGLPSLVSKFPNIKRLVSNKHHGQVILGFKGIKDKRILYLKDVFDMVMQQPSYTIAIAFVCTFLITWSTGNEDF